MTGYMTNISWKYIKPLISRTAVSDFEKEAGIMIPDDLKQCLESNNGGRPSKNVFDTEHYKEKEMKALLSFNKTDTENIYAVYSAMKGEIKGLVPFASDPGGDFLCLYKNKIVLYFHETNAVEKVADSFTEFLSKLYSI